MDIDNYTVEASGTLLDAAQAISKNKSRCVVVIEQEKVLGVLSEGDLVRALLRGTDIMSLMRGFVRHGFVYLEESDYERALQMFRTHGISLIPVLNQSLMLQGVITLSDLLARVSLDPSKARA